MGLDMRVSIQIACAKTRERVVVPPAIIKDDEPVPVWSQFIQCPSLVGEPAEDLFTD